jgi:predicted nuclease with TOPRIM domain
MWVVCIHKSKGRPVFVLATFIDRGFKMDYMNYLKDLAEKEPKLSTIISSLLDEISLLLSSKDKLMAINVEFTTEKRLLRDKLDKLESDYTKTVEKLAQLEFDYIKLNSQYQQAIKKSAKKSWF